MEKYIISVVGPTAVGKTKVAIELAEYFKTEVISADSRQLYKEMEIGTAKPTAQELRRVKHHFISSHTIFEAVSAGKFEKLVLNRIEQLFGCHDFMVMVGGSGLYIDAIVKGLSQIPAISPEVRKRLNDRLVQEGLQVLVEDLYKVDPVYAANVDKNNPQRVVRALEVYEGTGIAYSQWRTPTAKKRNFTTISIGLELDRKELYQRIDSRMDAMIEAGLFEEAEKLFQYRHLNALQTVGYKEIFDYKLGLYDREECIRLLKRNSRRYAKRQLTWFKKDESTVWFDPNNLEKIISHVHAVTS